MNCSTVRITFANDVYDMVDLFMLRNITVNIFFNISAELSGENVSLIDVEY